MSEAAAQAIGERAHSEVWARVASERAPAAGAPAVVVAFFTRALLGRS